MRRGYVPKCFTHHPPLFLKCSILRLLSDRLCWARGLVCSVPQRVLASLSALAGARCTARRAAITRAWQASRQPAARWCPGSQDPGPRGPIFFGMRRPLRDCRRAAPISSSARFQFADLDVSERRSPMGIGREWAFSDLTYRRPLFGPQRVPHLSLATGYSNSLIAEEQSN